MKYEDRHVLDKPAREVMKMYADRRFFERKYKDGGAWDIEVLEHEKSDKKFRIKCRRNEKNEAIPDFAKKFMGDTATIVQQDTWDIEKMTGRLDIEIKGAPVKVVAEMALVDQGKGSANVMKWSITCGIPLIGGKLEQVVGNDIMRRSKADEAITQKILKDY